MALTNDDLWPHFVPVWRKLLDLGSGEMLQIAGGYGLLLKQQWLLEHRDVLIVVPLESWLDSAPRATSDFDLLLGLEFISNLPTNKEIPAILKASGFEVTKKKLGQRWQFVKQIADEKVVLAELHAPTPDPEREDLRTEEVRIKPKRSLKGEGVHGRHNKEAVGSEMFPFRFNLESVPLAVPNPVTWTLMKLTAMADYWGKAHQSDLTGEIRAKARKQAEKHARDVCRTIAMTTIEERDRAADVLESIRDTEPFRKAEEIFLEAFRTDAWALTLVQDNWESADLDIILSVLENWFSASHS